MILVAEFMDVASANTALKLVGAAIHTFLQLLRLALFPARTQLSVTCSTESWAGPGTV